MNTKLGRDALPRVRIFSVNRRSLVDEPHPEALASLRSLTLTIEADPQVGPTTR